MWPPQRFKTPPAAIAFFYFLGFTAGASQSVAKPPGWFNVKDYGAAGDGITLETSAFRKTIDACVRSGGGTVFVPPGKYLTGTVRLESNVTLWVDSGAAIIGSGNLKDYQAPVVEPEGWFYSLIQARDARNVAIAGPGTIDGNNVYNPGGFERMRGPQLILIDHCTDVTIRDVRLKDASNFAIFVRFSEAVSIDGVAVRGGWDGVHLYAVQNISITNSKFWTGDDCIAGCLLKNVTVTNCHLNTACNGFRIGGENVLIANCLIYGPADYPHRTSDRYNLVAGINIFTAQDEMGLRRQPWMRKPAMRAIVDNVMISNVAMVNVRTPLSVRPWGAGSAPVGRITLSNVTVTGAGKTPVVVWGPGQRPFESLVFDNVRMWFGGGVTPADAEASGTGEFSLLPSYGFYLRNVGAVELRNVLVNVKERDSRPALVAEDVGKLEFDGFRTEGNAAGGTPFALNGVRGVVDYTGRIPKSLPVVRDLDVEAGDTGGKVVAGAPFSVIAVVRNAGQAGLAELGLHLGGKRVTNWVWLEKGESKRIPFRNLVCQEPGQPVLQAGAFTRKLVVERKPAAPVFAYKDLKVRATAPGEFQAAATVSNYGMNPGTAQAALLVNGRPQASESIRLGPGEVKSVKFAQHVAAPGKYDVRIGDAPPETVVLGSPVKEPYRTFANTTADFQQFENGIFIKAGGAGVLYRDDEYGAVYWSGRAKTNTVIVAKLRDPEGASGWGGRAGLVFRNNLSMPGKSAGYVLLAASGGNGWSLEWDEDGDGRIDHHTALDGYTLWPHWLKLERRGDQFSGWVSTDGVNWSKVGQARVPTAGALQDAGLLVSSMGALFEQVSVRDGT